MTQKQKEMDKIFSQIVTRDTDFFRKVRVILANMPYATATLSVTEDTEEGVLRALCLLAVRLDIAAVENHQKGQELLNLRNDIKAFRRILGTSGEYD